MCVFVGDCIDFKATKLYSSLSSFKLNAMWVDKHTGFVF